MHIRDLFDMTGKVAIVTGGSRGLGKEMAIGLGEAGAKVVITARREKWLTPAAQELEGMGIECLPVIADVGEVEGVRNLVSQTLQKWGKIDVLVNNAGIVWAAPSEEMPLDRWDSVLNTNAKGLFICCQEVGKQMIKQKSGNIVNISSVTGVVGLPVEVGQMIGYQASKAAVIIMTKQLAVEWAGHNIRVNCIAPHFFSTRLTERVGKEEEVKGITVFLASEASSYVTGQVICLDGGTTAW